MRRSRIEVAAFGLLFLASTFLLGCPEQANSCSSAHRWEGRYLGRYQSGSLTNPTTNEIGFYDFQIDSCGKLTGILRDNVIPGSPVDRPINGFAADEGGAGASTVGGAVDFAVQGEIWNFHGNITCKNVSGTYRKAGGGFGFFQQILRNPPCIP